MICLTQLWGSGENEDALKVLSESVYFKIWKWGWFPVLVHRITAGILFLSVRTTLSRQNHTGYRACHSLSPDARGKYIIHSICMSYLLTRTQIQPSGHKRKFSLVWNVSFLTRSYWTALLPRSLNIHLILVNLWVDPSMVKITVVYICIQNLFIVAYGICVLSRTPSNQFLHFIITAVLCAWQDQHCYSMRNI